MLGFIYIIWVLDQFYIGSTWDFDKREIGHNKRINTYNYKLYVAIRGNNNEFVMLVHHKIICDTDEELRQEEQKTIDELQPTLNTNRAYNSEEYHAKYYELHKEEKAEYRAKYYEENKEKINEKSKQDHIDNPNKYKLINEKKKQDRIDNPEKQKEYNEKRKQDRIDNPEKYKEHLEKNKEKMTCICGKIFRKQHKCRHEQSNFHIDFCKENNIV